MDVCVCTVHTCRSVASSSCASLVHLLLSLLYVYVCVSPMAMLDFRLIMMFDYNNDCCDCLPDFLSFLCACVCACVNVCVCE